MSLGESQSWEGKMLGHTERVEYIAQLMLLCDEAADQMALAHKMLDAAPDKMDVAIAHMDAALACLKQCEARR